MSGNRRRMMKHKNVSDIPLQYIATHKGNYVDTGIVPQANYNIECEFELIEPGIAVLGARETISSKYKQIMWQCLTSGTFYVYYGSSGYAYNQKLNFSGNWNKYKISLITTTNTTTSALISINNATATDMTRNSTNVTSSGFPNIPIYLYDCNVNNSTSQNKEPYIKIRSFKVTDTSKRYILINLLPVLHNGVPCFHDSVTDNYFYIQGNNDTYYD